MSGTLVVDLEQTMQSHAQSSIDYELKDIVFPASIIAVLWTRNNGTPSSRI
jgi:hypothetical protein